MNEQPTSTIEEALWRPPVLVPLPRAIVGALGGRKVAFIHTRRDLRARIAQGQFPFFNRLCALLNKMGFDVAVMPLYRPPWVRWFNRGCLHIYRGPGRPRRGPGVLHVAKGYIEGYWYIDPMGHRENSSIVDRQFRPKRVPEDGTIELYGQLRRRHAFQGHSSRGQVEKGQADVRPGAIAIMLQRMEPGEPPKGAICTEAEMIRAVVAGRGTYEVMIKYHPFGVTKDVRAAVEDVLDPKAGVHLVDANVHDVLDAASMVCTQTSGVGFEAFLHRTPTLLFAGADYHHATIPVTSLDALPDLIATAKDQRFLYAKYVYWFLEMNLFRPDAPDFNARAREVIEGAITGEGVKET